MPNERAFGSAAFRVRDDRTWTVGGPRALGGVGCCGGEDSHPVAQQASEHGPAVARLHERYQLIEATLPVLALQGVYKVICKQRRPVWHSYKPCMHSGLRCLCLWDRPSTLAV